LCEMGTEKGAFITFEGDDGCGKTSTIGEIAPTLMKMGVSVLSVHEPGGTQISEQIRGVLSAHGNHMISPRTEALLFQGARAQLVDEKILPWLKAGGVVLSDRFYDSTLAYQGYARGLDMGELRQLIKFATGGLKPDLTLFFDVQPEIGLARASGRGEMDRLDLEKLPFHKKVYEGYQALMKEEPQRWRRVDAGKDLVSVQAEATGLVLEFLRLRGIGLLGL